MTAQDFKDWIEFMGLSDAKAAEALGAHRNSMKNWKENGAPKYIELACNALTYRLPCWKHADGVDEYMNSIGRVFRKVGGEYIADIET